MAPELTTTFLDLAVGHYRLALKTDCVVGILADQPALPTLRFREAEVPLVDLSSTFSGRARAQVPFVVAVEARSGRVLLGVDTVGHLRLAADARLLPLPGFGLARPDLFSGVLRDGQGLLMLLSPEALPTLSAAKSGAI